MPLDKETEQALSAFAVNLTAALSQPFKLTAEEFRRRAMLEAEIAETLSYQRHRIDKLERQIKLLNERQIEYECTWVDRLKLWWASR